MEELGVRICETALAVPTIIEEIGSFLSVDNTEFLLPIVSIDGLILSKGSVSQEGKSIMSKP